MRWMLAMLLIIAFGRVAEACGVADERLIALGRVFVHRIRDVARTDAEVENARIAHEGTMISAAGLVAHRREKICPAVMAEFARLEKACLPDPGPVCVEEIEALLSLHSGDRAP